MKLKPNNYQLYASDGWFAVYAVDSCADWTGLSGRPSKTLPPDEFSKLWSGCADHHPTDVILGVMHVCKVVSSSDVTSQTDWFKQLKKEDDVWYCWQLDARVACATPYQLSQNSLNRKKEPIWACGDEDCMKLHSLRMSSCNGLEDDSELQTGLQAGLQAGAASGATQRDLIEDEFMPDASDASSSNNASSSSISIAESIGITSDAGGGVVCEIAQIDEKLKSIQKKIADVAKQKLVHAEYDLKIRRYLHNIIDVAKRLEELRRMEVGRSREPAAEVDFEKTPLFLYFTTTMLLLRPSTGALQVG